MGTNFERWLDTYQRRRLPGWMRRRRATSQRLKPLHARSHKAARLIRERRYLNARTAETAAHVRGVERDGDDGLRCPDCHHIPIKPWEPEPEDGWECGCDGAEGCVFR